MHDMTGLTESALPNHSCSQSEDHMETSELLDTNLPQQWMNGMSGIQLHARDKRLEVLERLDDQVIGRGDVLSRPDEVAQGTENRSILGIQL